MCALSTFLSLIAKNKILAVIPRTDIPVRILNEWDI